MKTLNLKEFGASKEDCVVLVDMFLEESKREGVSAVKILHGYGSHGVGGVLYLSIRRHLADLKRKKKIKNYFGGNRWNLLDDETVNALLKDKSCFDEDLNKSNPGITIILI